MNFLGIDTSAYTTSLAVVNHRGELLWENRSILKVPLGETGLAQSEAFFQHVQNLPQQIQMLSSDLWNDLNAVGVSMTPRPVQGSYMPVFTAGYAVAQAMASARGVLLHKTSHQEGHIAAGLASAQGPEAKRFLAVHLSGGTTEILVVERNEPGKFKLELLGGTNDLHAGQFVDRVGVLLGLPFPSGKSLEIMARDAGPHAASLLPSSVKGLEVSFSGVETAARRLLKGGVTKNDVARAVEGCIARSIAKLIRAGYEYSGLNNILIVGGVSANLYLRAEIAKRLGPKVKLYWAVPEWSRDNAIGVAILTKEVCELK